MKEAGGLERAIAGALRGAIHDHGPIDAKAIGSATKRVLGNLRNARPARPIEPGEWREETAYVLRCRCARCGHEWTVLGVTVPDRCESRKCRARTWYQVVPRKAGRPKTPKPPAKE